MRISRTCYEETLVGFIPTVGGLGSEGEAHTFTGVWQRFWHLCTHGRLLDVRGTLFVSDLGPLVVAGRECGAVSKRPTLSSIWAVGGASWY